MKVVTLTLLLLGFTTLVVGAAVDLQPSTNALCPVVNYDTQVVEMNQDELGKMKLSALLKDQAASAQVNQAKPYKVIVTPLSYTTNSSIPSVDWIDLHFKVNNEIQQNVQMKMQSLSSSSSSSSASSMQTVNMLSASAVAPELDSMNMASISMRSSSMKSHGPSQYTFGPIFLKPNDELSFAHTICASMIDCDTATQTFKPSQLKSKPKEEEQAKKKSSPPKQPVTNNVGCPAVSFTHKISCGDEKCKVSFINLSPNKPLDWVSENLSLRDNSIEDASFFQAVGSSQSDESSVKLNYQMKLAAGSKSSMKMIKAESMPPMQHDQAQIDQLTSAQNLELFGSDSSAQSLLAQNNANQVWQFALPQSFKSNEKLVLQFTYCQNGVDCDTELFGFQLQEKSAESEQEKVKKTNFPDTSLGQAGNQIEQQQQPLSVAQQLLQQPLNQHSINEQQSPLGFVSSNPLQQQLTEQQQQQLLQHGIRISTRTTQAQVPLNIALQLAQMQAATQQQMALGSSGSRVIGNLNQMNEMNIAPDTHLRLGITQQQVPEFLQQL